MSVDESRLNYLASNVSSAKFYSIGTLFVTLYFVLRIGLKLPEYIEPFLHSNFISGIVVGLLGLTIPSITIMIALMAEKFLHFKYGSEFEILFSNHVVGLRKKRINFVIAPFIIEFLIDIWFLFE